MLISQIGGTDRARLSGLPVLQLPLDRRHAAVPRIEDAVVTIGLPSPLLEDCRACARDHATSPDAVVLAALAALLHRYTATDDIVIGMLHATAEEPDAAWLRVSREAGFGSLLAAAAASLVGLEAGNEAAQDAVSRPDDRPLHLPVVLALGGHRDPRTRLDAAGSDLHVALDAEEDAATLRLTYNRAVLDEATALRIGRHLRTLLAAALDAPSRTVGSLPLLEPAEARLIETEWNATDRTLPEITIHAAISAQAERLPQASAILCGETSWTYAELERRACHIAVALQQAGAGAGSLIAFCLDRSPEMVASLLAILKTGAAYLPLDPGFTAGRLAMIIEDATPAILLTRRAMLPSLPEHAAALVLLDDLGEPALDDTREPALDDPGDPTSTLDGPGEPASATISADPAQASLALDEPAADSLAYVLYTSGSTGRPKGVEVTHRNVINFLCGMRERPGFSASDVLLAVTTISFDIAVLELLLPLFSGGVVVLASREAVVDPRRLAALIEESGCTVMQATPATWRALVESGWIGSPSLRILCGGEAMPRELADALLSRGLAVWNMYGPTETTVWSTVQQVEPRMASLVVPIGRPIANTRIYILDDDDSLCPIGVVGELHIGGAGVARGYRNRPELSAERFIASRFVAGERLYRTGDLARLRADGSLEWLGRRDNQVKIRGYRIEVQEIEAALERHPQVRAAAVRTWPDVIGQPALVAYLSIRGETEADLTQLRVFLRDTLPDYMMPARYVVLDSLPLTQNGKLDRNALPEPERLVGRSVSAATGGEREREIALLWETLLGASSIGLHDSFFDLGGDSLKAMTLLMRIEDSFGRRLTLPALFQNPTVASLAALLGEPASEISLPLATEIQPEGDHTALFWIDGGPMFLPLAGAMGRERPFLGITLMPHELAEVGFQPDLPTIARHLVRSIRTIRPQGPYLLGGYCAGGILAYEVASQLLAAGEQVPLLCLIDAENPADFRRVGSLGVELAKLRHHLLSLSRAASGSRLAYLRRHATSAWRRIVSRGEWKAVMRSEPFTLGEIMQPAADAYRPPLYPGTVALFQARRPRQLDLRPGWGKVVTGRLDAYDFPGAHGTMLEPPQVDRLAQLINARLAGAD